MSYKSFASFSLDLQRRVRTLSVFFPFSSPSNCAREAYSGGHFVLAIKKVDLPVFLSRAIPIGSIPRALPKKLPLEMKKASEMLNLLFIHRGRSAEVMHYTMVSSYEDLECFARAALMGLVDPWLLGNPLTFMCPWGKHTWGGEAMTVAIIRSLLEGSPLLLLSQHRSA